MTLHGGCGLHVEKHCAKSFIIFLKAFEKGSDSFGDVFRHD